MQEKFYPREENLGKECKYWNLDGRYHGCNYPKTQMEGRTSCEGIIDDVCLYLKDGRIPKDTDMLEKLKLQTPQFGQKPYIPPGKTTL